MSLTGTRTPELHPSPNIRSHSHKAFRYMVKVKIGGVAGLIAPLMGKQPRPMETWVLAEAPRPLSDSTGLCTAMVPPGGSNLLFLPNGPAVQLSHNNKSQIFNAILWFKPACHQGRRWKAQAGKRARFLKVD